jgi:hypothetical protein
MIPVMRLTGMSAPTEGRALTSLSAWALAPGLTRTQFPDTFPEIQSGVRGLGKTQHKAVNSFRRRLKQQGMVRLEVHVRKGDAALVRNVIRALANPDQEQATRTLLREHFGSRPAEGLKALLAAAPLEGIDLGRTHDFGRKVDL